MIHQIARNFISQFPIGTTLDKSEFVKFLLYEGVLEPIEDEYDSNQVIGFEQNIVRLRNQINVAALGLQKGYRIDVFERGKSLIVRSLLDVVIHDSQEYLTKIVGQVKNKMDSINDIIETATRENMTNRERDTLLRNFDSIMDDLENILDRAGRMHKRRTERGD